MNRQAWQESWSRISEVALETVRRAESLEALENIRLEYLGRKGSLTQLLKSLKDLSLEDRRELGGPANEFKDRLSAAIETRQTELSKFDMEHQILQTRLDRTLPGVPTARGRIHPLTQILEEITEILSRLGFSWADGPLVETERYNFEALNIPADHPARDLQDTFYLKVGDPPATLLLRTHTSPVQIRRMESQRPPVRIMAPGRVFRHEAVDASHSAVFHQVEGLYVDKNVTFADLKGTLFLQALYGPKTQTRFRPSYYPFTEPSADVEISCLFCSGSGCGVCKRTGWLEVLGAGVVHPNVFKAVDYDPNVWSGFAFGLGVERLAMLRLGVHDIRLFYQNDLRFLEQVG